MKSTVKNTVYETDWLASRPVFYNELTGKVSHNINDVIDIANFEFDPEGFNNYLDFGFSIFQQTPIKHVKFLRHSSRLTIQDDGKLEIEHFKDPVEKWIGKTTHEDDFFHLLYTSVNNWAKSVEGEIVVSLSGGYDSRLLCLMIEDKSRIRAFTYGTSNDQSKSLEVVRAKKVAEILGVKWEQINLGKFLLYFEEWDKLFGVSTHAHGMYHIEFYKKMMSKIEGNNPFLSGNLGDPCAGKHIFPKFKSHLHLGTLCVTHGQNASSTMSLLKSNNYLREQYYAANREKLELPLFRPVESMRFKIMLVSYLSTVPNYFGFKTWAPYMDSEIALSMITLPPSRRKNRLWQKEFFQKHGVDLESMKLSGSPKNTLNAQALSNIPLKPLDINLLGQIIQPKYIQWVNNNAKPPGVFGNLKINMHHTPVVRSGLAKLGLNKSNLKWFKAYNAYLTLKPIENLLKKREALYKSSF